MTDPVVSRVPAGVAVAFKVVVLLALVTTGSVLFRVLVAALDGSEVVVVLSVLVLRLVMVGVLNALATVVVVLALGADVVVVVVALVVVMAGDVVAGLMIVELPWACHWR